MSEIAGEVLKSQSDYDTAVSFLGDNRLIKVMHKEDGKAAALPTQKGFAFLNEWDAQNRWTLDRRITLYGVIVAIVGVLLALLESMRHKP